MPHSFQTPAAALNLSEGTRGLANPRNPRSWTLFSGTHLLPIRKNTFPNLGCFSHRGRFCQAWLGEACRQNGGLKQGRPFCRIAEGGHQRSGIPPMYIRCEDGGLLWEGGQDRSWTSASRSQSRVGLGVCSRAQKHTCRTCGAKEDRMSGVRREEPLPRRLETSPAMAVPPCLPQT